MPSEVTIPSDNVLLSGVLEPAGAGDALVLVGHGGAGARSSPRNRAIATALHDAGIGTLLVDLLTAEEETGDTRNAHLQYDIELLAMRLEDATTWAFEHCGTPGGVSLGYMGASTAAAAALRAAAHLGDRIGAVVSRGGRPDLAGLALERVVAPTLLVVGALDTTVIELNEGAYERLQCDKELVLVPDADHRFEARLARERVAALAADWFGRYLTLRHGLRRTRGAVATRPRP